jgi:energy-coupling factor transport system permease protein
MALVAFTVREWTGPIAMVIVEVVCAAAAGVGRRLAVLALATIPIVASILLVNTFLFPGATDRILSIGPFTATGTGLAAALQATLRVVAFALSVGLFSLTTRTDELLADLERRGLGRRATFILGSAIATIPRMAERAGEITESQRARGLDTEGSVTRRLRGIVPLAGPMIGGALAEVEERTMALEARAFSAATTRPVLRVFPDSQTQRVVRWVALLGAVGLGIASVSGLVRLP